jgi:plasmid rolling circle replication initiator protein Rep
MLKEKCQEVGEILVDKSSTGRVRPWAVQRLAADYIAMSYDEINPDKAQRIRDCAQWLSFVKNDKGGLKLYDARFCRVRLCPICQWRRALKTCAQMYQILDVASSQGYQYIFLTLTLKSCWSYQLDDELTHTLRAFNKFTRYKAVKDAVYGYYRGCEITYNADTNSYHPHLHCILAVKKSYFSGQVYLSQKKWTELWKRALAVDYTPIVHIKKCFGGKASVAEACKYCVKPGEVLQMEDWDLTVHTIATLDAATSGRRFVGLGGIFKEIHKKLQLDDIEDGDLVHTADSQEQEHKPEEIYFFWNGLRKNYYKG